MAKDFICEEKRGHVPLYGTAAMAKMHAAGKSHAQNEETEGGVMAQIRCVFAWELQIPARYRCPSHSHGSVEIVLSNRASGVLHQGGKRFSYRHHSVFVYQPGAEHWIENEKAGQHLCLGVVGCRADLVPEGVRQASTGFLIRFDEIREVLRGDDPSRQMRLDLLSGLVICDLLAVNSALRPPRTRGQQVRELIDASLSSPLSLDELARSVFVGKEYLRQLFRNEFGESITSYIVRRRIELAAQLLRTTSDAVKEIAGQSGFPDAYYFSRLFRKTMGASPSQWRSKLALQRVSLQKKV